MVRSLGKGMAAMAPDQEDLLSEDPSDERPMPRDVLDSPEMMAKIEKADERAKKRGVPPGSTADDLLGMARERRRVDSRT
jgi:hypothetical protein